MSIDEMGVSFYALCPLPEKALFRHGTSLDISIAYPVSIDETGVYTHALCPLSADSKVCPLKACNAAGEQTCWPQCPLGQGETQWVTCSTFEAPCDACKAEGEQTCWPQCPLGQGETQWVACSTFEVPCDGIDGLASMDHSPCTMQRRQASKRPCFIPCPSKRRASTLMPCAHFQPIQRCAPSRLAKLQANRPAGPDAH